MECSEESVADSLGILLLRSFRTGIVEEIVRDMPEPITAATYPVISGVARIGPVRVAMLSDQIGLERSVVARRSAVLIDAGLLRSTPDPDDARAARLALTPRGRRAVASMRRRLVVAITEHMRSWPAEDRETFARLLARFVDANLGEAAGPRA